jgi:hypothetical protein
MASAACGRSAKEREDDKARPPSVEQSAQLAGTRVGSARLYVADVRFANPERTVLGVKIGLENVGDGRVVSNENAFTVSACGTEVRGNENFEDYQLVKGFGETLPSDEVPPGTHVEGWVPFRVSAGCSDLVLKFDGLRNGEGSLELAVPSR